MDRFFSKQQSIEGGVNALFAAIIFGDQKILKAR
jgi:hypothetical protein